MIYTGATIVPIKPQIGTIVTPSVLSSLTNHVVVVVQETIQEIQSMLATTAEREHQGSQDSESATSALTPSPTRHHTTVGLFCPFKPMLAHRVNPYELDLLFKDTPMVRSFRGKSGQLELPTKDVNVDDKLSSEQEDRKPLEYILEPKYDGERLLCHVDKSGGQRRLKLFTRRSNDYTEIYGEQLSDLILDHVK